MNTRRATSPERSGRPSSGRRRALIAVVLAGSGATRLGFADDFANRSTSVRLDDTRRDRAHRPADDPAGRRRPGRPVRRLHARTLQRAGRLAVGRRLGLRDDRARCACSSARSAASSTDGSSPASGCPRSPSPSARSRSTGASPPSCSGTRRSPTSPQTYSQWATYTQTVPGTFIPYPVALFVVLAVVTAVVLHCHGFGRSLFAIGAQEDAAYFAGIRVKRIKLVLFVLAGLRRLLRRDRLHPAVRQCPRRQRRRPRTGRHRRRCCSAASTSTAARAPSAARSPVCC